MDGINGGSARYQLLPAFAGQSYAKIKWLVLTFAFLGTIV
jgi:hypothetical protein